MFTAIDNYQVGKEKESRAIDVYGKPGSTRHNRFRCPECGETVILTKNISPFFRHYKKTDISPECDRRVDGNCQLSYKERTGLALYIKKECGGIFSLYILMPTLSDNVIKEAERQESYVYNVIFCQSKIVALCRKRSDNFIIKTKGRNVA